MPHSMLKGIAGLVAVAVLAACGGEGADDAAPDAEEAAEAAAPAVDPATAGAIRGAVSFTGSPPAPQSIDMAEEPECADAYGEEGPTTQAVLVSEGRLANVFVHVREGAGEWPAPEEPVTLDQEHCRYDPHVLGLQVGQPLRITNSDPFLHNVNTQPTRNRPFNISQPQAGMETTRTFPLAEVMIPVKCDVHGWMNAYVGVVPHPYFGVTGADGAFELSELPPGDYVVEAWHEAYGTLSQEVTVGEAETVEVAFEFSADMAGSSVPLGRPLVVRWHGEDGPTTVRAAAGGAGR